MSGWPEYTVGMTASESRKLEGSDLVDGALPTMTLHLFCEMACHNVLAPHYAADDASVGRSNDIWFWGDAAAGESLHCEAVITAVDGRRITFNVFARAGTREIARGTHERMLVSRSRFLASLPRRRIAADALP